jgi:hyperosmotically inducible periplasmic protein
MLNTQASSSLILKNAILMSLAMAMLGMPFAMAAETAANDQKTTAYEDSSQPVSDTWITTKIKADFLADDDIKGLDINVSTTNGVVSLAGLLDTQALVDKAVAVAKGTLGVTSVDSTALKVKPAK